MIHTEMKTVARSTHFFITWLSLYNVIKLSLVEVSRLSFIAKFLLKLSFMVWQVQCVLKQRHVFFFPSQHGSTSEQIMKLSDSDSGPEAASNRCPLSDSGVPGLRFEGRFVQATISHVLENLSQQLQAKTSHQV